MAETCSSDSQVADALLTKENWWEMIPGRNKGGGQLLKRCIELLSWRVDFAINVLMAYKDFLECKVISEDWDGNLLEPPMPIFQMWSQHIMDTQNYAKDMELLFGRVLHYNPNLYKDFENRDARIHRTMKMIHERCYGRFVDPMIWHYQPTKPPPEFVSYKRPRLVGHSPDVYEGVPCQVPGSAHSYRSAVPARRVDEAIKEGLVTLAIFKVTDGGLMDNIVTVHRDKPLRTVLEYNRFRCMWRNGKRLNLHSTPNELHMSHVENIVLTSIHVDEIITLWFNDWKGNRTPRQLKMRDTIGYAFEGVAYKLGVKEPSKLKYSLRGNPLSPNSTPALFLLDHDDVLDVALPDGGEMQHEADAADVGEEKKEQHKEISA